MIGLRELSPAQVTQAPAPPAAVPTPRGDEPSAFARLVRGFAHEADRGEATVRSVLEPRTAVALDAPHLLALQAGIYRYGETMDLAARLVDKASSAVKTVVQGQ